MKRAALAVLALSCLAGCVIVYDEGPRERRPVPPPTRVTYTCTWTDVRYVLWAEYFGCHDDDVTYCESLRDYDDCDVFVLLFIARHARVPVRHVLLEYDRSGRSLFTVALTYRLTGDEFFCEEVPRHVHCPPPYGNAYGYYWNRQRHYRLTNEECRALVDLRIGVHFYGHTAAAYFQDYEKCRSRGEAHPFRTIAVRDHKKAGAGGKDCVQKPCGKADRPWEAPNHQEWEKRRETAREKARANDPSRPAKGPDDDKARKEDEKRGRQETDRKPPGPPEETKKRPDENPKPVESSRDEKPKKEEPPKKSGEDSKKQEGEGPKKQGGDESKKQGSDDSKKQADDAKKKQEEENKKKKDK